MEICFVLSPQDVTLCDVKSTNWLDQQSVLRYKASKISIWTKANRRLRDRN